MVGSGPNLLHEWMYPVYDRVAKRRGALIVQAQIHNAVKGGARDRIWDQRREHIRQDIRCCNVFMAYMKGQKYGDVEEARRSWESLPLAGIFPKLYAPMPPDFPSWVKMDVVKTIYVPTHLKWFEECWTRKLDNYRREMGSYVYRHWLKELGGDLAMNFARTNVSAELLLNQVRQLENELIKKMAIPREFFTDAYTQMTPRGGALKPRSG